ncbi:MAG TPA: nucleotidyltransferase family protein, partial [Thermoanaerobaculia bacterium]|nr:nucleotidyltransferase family protein [Thermoanaerobaculia bacterium]
RVAPLVATSLAACGGARLGVAPAVAARLEAALFENVAARELLALRLAEVLAAFAARGLEALLVKGAALEAVVEERPWLTVARDLDLVLRPGPAAPPGESARDLRRALYPEGIECDWLAHHDVTMNGVLAIDFERIWARARLVRWRGLELRLPAAEDRLLALAVAVSRKRYARLKGLYDLAEAIAAGDAAGEWAIDGGELAARAAEGAAEGVLYTALRAVEAMIDTPPPAGTLAALPLGRGRRRALDALLSTFLRRGSFVRRRGGGLALLLAYGCLRPGQAWRALGVGLRRRRRTETEAAA